MEVFIQTIYFSLHFIFKPIVLWSLVCRWARTPWLQMELLKVSSLWTLEVSCRRCTTININGNIWKRRLYTSYRRRSRYYSQWYIGTRFFICFCINQFFLAVKEVNNNVTYVLRTIIAGSQRFAHHSRRTRILPEDVDSHLALERKPVSHCIIN